MSEPVLLPLPSYRDLREHFDADADYERLWRARLLLNTKVRAINAKLEQWHLREFMQASNVVELSMFHRRQAS